MSELGLKGKFMKRMVKIAGYAAIAIAIVYSGYWFIAASFIKTRIDLAFSHKPPIGRLNLGDITVTGFPQNFDINIRDFSLAHDNTFRWSTPGARLSAASLDPTRLDIDLSRPHAIGGRWGDMVLDTERAQVIALFGKTTLLPLQDLRFALEGAKLGHSNGLGLAAEKIIAVIKNREGEDPGVYSVETEITGTDITKIFPELPNNYRRLGPIRGSANIFFTSGWAAGDLTASLPVFRGAILEKLSASIGNSELNLNGTLQINPDSSVSGNVTLTITQWRELLNLAKLVGKIDGEGEEVFAEILSEVEALSGKPGTLELPLVIKNGAVTYGVFTLGVIPPIR